MVVVVTAVMVVVVIAVVVVIIMMLSYSCGSALLLSSLVALLGPLKRAKALSSTASPAGEEHAMATSESSMPACRMPPDQSSQAQGTCE